MRVVCSFLLISFSLAAGCGGSSSHGSSSSSYEEYVCPAPIGKIVREDCSRSALRYDGAEFQASAGVGSIGASGAYRDTAVRQADALVSMLKEQRVQLCNDFNTCKTTVAEYGDASRRLDESYVALLALKDRMAQLDAEGAAKLLSELQRIRASVSAKTAASGGEPLPDSPKEAARVYYEAFTSGNVDRVFNASTATMQTNVWKSREELRKWRDGVVDDCGPEKALIVETYVTVDRSRGYLRHLAEHARKRCETTIYVDEVTRQISGWAAWYPKPEPTLPKFSDAKAAGAAYYKAFVDNEIELVYAASTAKMQREVWNTYGNLGLWRRDVIEGSGPEQSVVTETVADDHGRDRYERIAQYEKRKARFRIWMDRASHQISGWMTETVP